jgi:hypothetical protein
MEPEDMMPANTRVRFLLISAFLVGWQAVAALNVRDFGAVGDSLTDDTDAIQRALLAAGGQDIPTEVVFPKALYRTTRPLLVPGSISLRGVDGAGLITAGTHDFLYIHRARRVAITGMTFLSGGRHIRIEPDGEELGMVHITDCLFRKGEGFAIECMRLQDPETGQALAPYRLEKAADSALPRLVAQDESHGRPVACNIFLSIEDSSFQACRNVVGALCEMTVVRNCMVDTARDMRGGAFRTTGRLLLDRVHGVAHPTQGLKQHWVTAMGGTTILRSSTFESRERWGLCAVYASRRSKDEETSVVIDRCSFAAAGNEERCLVYCDDMPNVVSVRDSAELTGIPVDILGFRELFDEKTLAPRTPDEAITVQQWFTLDVGQDNRNLVANVPESLQSIAAKLFSPGMADEFTSPAYEVPVVPPGMPKRTLSVRDFGAVGDGVADDAPAMAKALRELEPEDELFVPAGRYRLGSPVKLPRRVTIRGEGWPVFVVGETATRAFGVKNALYVWIMGVAFEGGTTALEVSTAPDREAVVQLRQCVFLNTTEAAVSCLSGRGKAREPNRSQLRVTTCEFRECAQAIQTNFDQSLLDQSLLAGKRGRGQDPAVASLGRSLIADSVWGIPRLPTDKPTDSRWFDAYGRLHCRNVRFGAEDGGFTAARLRAGERGVPELLLENCDLWCGGNLSRPGMVQLETAPRMVAIRSCLGSVGKESAIVPDKTVKVSPAGFLHANGNILPTVLVPQERK